MSTLVDTWVPVDAKEEISARFNKMVKRATRIGFPVPVITWQETKTGTMDGPDAEGKNKVLWQHVTIDGLALKVGDWTLIASIDPLTIENERVAFFRPVPGETVPEQWRQVDPSICQHCNAVRYRTETFLIRNGDEYKQVGRQCIRDFLGHSPDAIVSYIGFLLEMSGWFDESDDGGWSGYTDRNFWTPSDIISLAARIVAVDGFFVSRAKEREAHDAGDFSVTATASTAMDFLYAKRGSKVEQKYGEGVPVERMDELISLTTQELDALDRNTDNDWKYNLWAAWNSEYIGYRQFGLMISGILLGIRKSENMQREREDYLAAKAGKKFSSWVGEVGQRITATVTITGVVMVGGDFRFTSWLVSMLDTDGNVMKWFASNPPECVEKDATVTITGTVKKHDEYRGQKQTVLTRCKVEK